jgi:hypothetical protein
MKCPFCGRALELVEDGERVWFGCAGCLRYVVASKCELVRRYINRKRRVFNWRGIVLELYSLYASGWRQL